MQLARWIGERRAEENRAMARPDRKQGEQDGVAADRNAAAGELAFCKLANVWPDLSLRPRSSQREGDCRTLAGETIDVKTTTLDAGRLLATSWHRAEISASWFVLMIGDIEHSGIFRFAGAMPASELLRAERVQDLGFGECFAASQAQLSGLPLSYQAEEARA